ncbi:ABC transporter ATP-binding protein [Flavobacterium ovatum]|uniref:ABC transporter ATP-binding protein n=1 Tax=Flavobacterium ovatum TaxID=1928857 RepID=UPI00344CCD84
MSILVQNISKSYSSTLAVDKVSFDVNEGELFGLIGPDGAGKTTVFRILTTLLLADEGIATVTGFDVKEEYKAIRNSVGYMPGRFSLYMDLTVEENLTFFATIFGTTIKQNYDLIHDIYVQIEPFKNRRAGALSGGMKQKLALCCALIHNPSVLFLDEPTTGVDPVSRKEFWEMLQRLKQKGITILVSTPYMDEAALCDRIALIHKGKILQIDSPQHIIDSFTRTIYNVQTKNMHQLIEDLKQYSSQHSVFAFGEYVHYMDQKTDFYPEKLSNYLKDKNHLDIKIDIANTTIEDVFMDYTAQKTTR